MNPSVAIPDRDFRDLSNSLAELKGSFASTKGTVKLVVPVIAAAILAAFAWCWTLGSRVTAIQQQLADGGNTKLVAQFKTPESGEQLAANLLTVAAAVQTARAKGVEPDNKTAALSKAVSQVIQRDPAIPEAWQAASQLVSFRTVDFVRNKSLPPCDTAGAKPVEKWHGTADHNAEVEAGYFYSNCTLDLSTLPPQNKKGTYHLSIVDNGRLATDKSIHTEAIRIEPSDEDLQFPIYAEDAVIVASNASTPFGNNDFVFRNCRFQLSVYTVPDTSISKLLLAGLSQSDPSFIKIDKSKPAS